MIATDFFFQNRFVKKIFSFLMGNLVTFNNYQENYLIIIINNVETV